MAHTTVLGGRLVLRPARSKQPPLRLTRRGRIVLVVLPMFVATLALLVAWAGFAAPARAGSEHLVGPGTAVTVTVQPGDSLWTIAADRVPDQDPRVTISQIRELNGLRGSRVLPGEQIMVPVTS
ncbi:LysM peptidoglycan-binding domain-containing protein [Sinomonas sp. P10A9]|uniref:LysM peptidoglycan-binding domain-containing protein n=1 Tax=Sinomonas puerhi TaxID=3238584 RepID=A0AB39L7C9_9MICC